MNLLTRAREAVERWGMLPEAGPVVAAVSGGPDSMALLVCLEEILGAEARGRLVVAHLHHGLRESADSDAEFVRGESTKAGLRFVLGREDVPALAREEGLSVEAAARRARYAFLTRAAVDLGAEAVALGHNADDQAETVLLRLFRGAGLRGAGGMRPVRPAGRDAPGVRFVRPLLEATRGEIERFLEERGVAFRLDETNLDVRFRRNRLRREIIPAVREALQPRLVEVLGRFARLAREASDHIEAEAARAFSGAAEGTGLAIPRALWEGLAPALRGPALRLIFERAAGRALASAHVEAVRSLVESSRAGETDLPGGWRARVSPEGVAFVSPDDNDENSNEEPDDACPWDVELPVPGTADLPDGRVISAEVRERGGREMPPRSSDRAAAEEWADYEALGRPERLVVRSRRAGDRFRPLGSGGSRSVKRFLIDMKLPRGARAKVPVVAAPDGAIVWVAPFRLDERARVSPGTKTVLVLALEERGRD